MEHIYQVNFYYFCSFSLNEATKGKWEELIFKKNNNLINWYMKCFFNRLIIEILHFLINSHQKPLSAKTISLWSVARLSGDILKAIQT